MCHCVHAFKEKLRSRWTFSIVAAAEGYVMQAIKAWSKKKAGAVKGKLV